MKLIDNASQCWKMLSVHAFGLVFVLAGLQAEWTALPDAVKALLPATWLPWITGATAIAGVIARLVKQEAVSAGVAAPKSDG